MSFLFCNCIILHTQYHVVESFYMFICFYKLKLYREFQLFYDFEDYLFRSKLDSSQSAGKLHGVTWFAFSLCFYMLKISDSLCYKIFVKEVSKI